MTKSDNPLADYTRMSVDFWRKATREYQLQHIKIGRPPRPGAQDRRQIQIWKPAAKQIIERINHP